MLDRYERRRLDEIEHQLSGDDPHLAELMSNEGSRRSRGLRFNLRTGIIVFSYACALLCLVLGEGAGFFLGVALATVMIGLYDWTMRAV
ncbi:hypothetical protein J2S53_000990 [Actinopolyspora lacussalsi]|uniref:DUF3040 domain-containing protein n=1 Tax=Actinopolyspora righensis TaxID=995060 RepID=A0A1I6X4J9_9ACTN|nr:DUF3040 domain-containing protein [Actinopolyspora righensis]MDP9641045.1 hypothetical protein [Actinopolyspora lacussalsi]SFT32861.1 Protein of unknown function [Actinopolyspora righensis]